MNQLKGPLGMRRQLSRTLIWLVLGSFFSFSICLPLGHVCLNQGFHTSPKGVHAAALSYNSGQDRFWQPDSFGENHQNDVCQACLLGQNILLDRGHVELAAIRSISSALDRIYAPVIPIARFFQSASKRAPPVCA